MPTALHVAKNLPAICALFATMVGCYRLINLDLPSKIYWLKTCAGFFVEGLALLAAIRYGNNMPVYAIYSLIDFVLTAAYFNYSIDVFRSKRIGLIICAGGVVVWALNVLFLQPLLVLSSYFMYLQGIVAIGLSLFSFFRLLLMSEELRLPKLRHFWFAIIICLFWSITFFNWGLYGYFAEHEKEWMWLINLSIIIVSSLNYLAIAVVFWYYPRLKATYE